MLLITVKKNETVKIGKNGEIKIKITGHQKGKYSLAFEADKNLEIKRVPKLRLKKPKRDKYRENHESKNTKLKSV